MKQLALARKVNKQTVQWSEKKDKLVVAIDGYTGIGKTTLLNNLRALNGDILAVNRDDFLISRIKLQKLLKQAKDRSVVFELDIRENKKITRLIQAFRSNKKIFTTKIYDAISGKISITKHFDTSKNILVIEGVFMFHPKLQSHLWDKKIYLDGDTDQIDKRRVKREKKRWGKDYFPETHPDSYFRQVIIALKRYRKLYKPQKQADLVIKV